MAAARWMGNWPRLSLTLVDALCAMSLRAVSRVFFEAQKWSAVWKWALFIYVLHKLLEPEYIPGH